MSLVDWAHVVLPLVALVIGIALVRRFDADIDRWIKERLEAD